MRTESSSSSARIKKKKRSSEHSKRHDRGADEGEWTQFTSPDGHPYFYNAVTKESRWELPKESVRSKHRRPKGSSKQVVLEEEEDEPLEQVPIRSKKDKKKQSESVAVDKQEAEDTPKPKNAMFQKLQASLEGRFNAMNGPMMGIGRPPPMLIIRRGEEDFAGEATESETKTPTLEEQYEAETARMSAAERLRFLRKKRQENMMTKRESVSGDDFMAEVANNMKKKEATRKPQEKSGSDKVLSWKEQEEAEEERKRQQMQAEMEAKEQEEARKEREQQAAIEREQRREQECAEQLALEQRREQKRKQQEESRQEQEEEEKQKMSKKKKEEAVLAAELNERSSGNEISNTNEMDVAERGQLSSDALPDSSSDVSSPERVSHRRRSRSKHGSSVISVEESVAKQLTSTEHEHSPVKSKQTVIAEDAEDAVLDENQHAREERRARELREKELSVSSSRALMTPESPRRKSISSANGHKEESSTRSTSSIETEEEVRAREKQLRREKRRMANVEAALAAQNLGDRGDYGDAQHKRDRKGSPGDRMEQHDQSSITSGSSHSGGSMNGQPHPGQAQFSGGMYAPYPYMMMPPPPPPPTPYGYYYPYMQPPPMMSMYPPGMVGVPPGYQLMPPTPPPSLDGMGAPSAMVPYGADSTPFGAMYGQHPAPELSRCECCKGIGVGLVEKNGVCAHCNRLRLAFIVDSAQMRQRCSVCSGWGFQLLQANGMCEHCTRQTARKSQRKLVTEAAAQRRSSLAAPPAVSVSAPRRNSTGNPKNEELDDIDWDRSSSGDSDWDD